MPFPGDMPFPGGGMPFPGMTMDGDGNIIGGAGGAEAKEVDNSRLYALLELNQDCCENDVKKAYKRAAMKHHPDRGGDENMFKDISLAHEVLSDPERRTAYDRYGEDSLEGDGPGAGGPQDIFEAMFGGGNMGGGKQKKKTTKDIVRPVWVTLESLYSGITKQLPIARKVLDDSSGASTCKQCSGSGVVTQVIRMGPMVQEIEGACPKCNGSGSSVPQKTSREVLDVFVEKGAPDGHKITLHGKADEQAGCEPGDVVVVVKQQDHPRFLRKGADLFLEQEISLGEALTGFKICVTHLDGRKLMVSSKVGEVLEPKQGGVTLKAVAGAGMPFHQDPFKYGNLFLVISIRFPRYIDPVAAGELRALLGVSDNAGDMQGIDGTEDEIVAVDIDPFESAKLSEAASKQAYDADEEAQMPGGIPCQQQ